MKALSFLIFHCMGVIVLEIKGLLLRMCNNYPLPAISTATCKLRTSQVFVYCLYIFSSPEAIYESAVFRILGNKAFQPCPTCIIVVTQHIIRYAYENVNFSSFYYPTTINSHSGYQPILVNSTGEILTFLLIRLRGTGHTRNKFRGIRFIAQASLQGFSTRIQKLLQSFEAYLKD